MIEASSFELLVADEQWASIAPTDTHTLAKGSQGRVILLFIPDLVEWLAIL